jgi:TPR repeat protein
MRKIIGVLAGLALSTVCVNGAAAQSLPVTSGTTVVKTSSAAGKDVARDKETLVELQQAAKAGDLRALLRIGELFEMGAAGLPKDPLRACQIYAIAVEQFNNVDRYDAGAALVARAFRQAAKCSAEGTGGWPRNVELAVPLYLHAGITLRDPAATFELARIFLSGGVIPPNAALAIQMLQKAALKQYAPAQALLGSLMWQGKVMQQDKSRGLALLMVGLEHAPAEYRDLIKVLFDEAKASASKQDEAEALILVRKYKEMHTDPTRDQMKTNMLSGEPPLPPSRSPIRELQDFIGEMDSYTNMPTGATGTVPAPAQPAGTTQQRK